MTAVTKNMKRAQKRNAVMDQKLFFRKGLSTCKTPPGGNRAACCTPASEEVIEMSINEIINGNSLSFIEKAVTFSSALREFADNFVVVYKNCTIILTAVVPKWNSVSMVDNIHTCIQQFHLDPVVDVNLSRSHFLFFFVNVCIAALLMHHLRQGRRFPWSGSIDTAIPRRCRRWRWH